MGADLDQDGGEGCEAMRRRWQNYLNNDIKQGGWSEEEDRILLEGHRLHGNKWTEIARMVTGRTDNAVKNRHAVLVKKEEKKVEDSHGGGTPSGLGKRKRAPLQPPDASSPKRGSRPTPSDNSPSVGSWRPKLSVKIPGASGASGWATVKIPRGGRQRAPSSHKAPPSLEALPTSASLTQVEIELLKQVQDLISPRAEGLGLGLGPEPAKAAAPQTPLDTPTVDMQAVMNWILSVTPRAGAGGGGGRGGNERAPAKRMTPRLTRNNLAAPKPRTERLRGSTASSFASFLLRNWRDRMARMGLRRVRRSRLGARMANLRRRQILPLRSSTSCSTRSVAAERLPSGLTGGVNPFGRAADSAPAPAEKEKEKEKEKGKVKAHNTRSPRATRSRK